MKIIKYGIGFTKYDRFKNAKIHLNATFSKFRWIFFGPENEIDSKLKETDETGRNFKPLLFFFIKIILSGLLFLNIL